jgi:hypothetical protein
LLSVVLPCCSAIGNGEASSVSDTSDEMPLGSTWQGVYQGPYHIYLRILTDGSRATGNWRAVGERNGEFTGEISGNVLNLTWTERGSDSSSWSGRGYFVYDAAESDGADEIHGEWGIGHMATGNSWWALRRADVSSSSLASSLVDRDSGGDDDKADAPECTIGCDEDEIDPE